QLGDRKSALTARLEEANSNLSEILNKGRDKALGPRHDNPLRPIAAWNFDHDIRDQAGSLHAEPDSKAILEAGRLRATADTSSAYLTTHPINHDVREKTLEVWLTVRKKPDQTAVSVLQIQNKSGFRGAAVDGIQYAGGDKKQWQNSSTAGFRTGTFEAPPET